MGKKQHYVPRVLLRGFATPHSEKLINIYLLEKGEIKYDCGLYEQAQRNNLYGADQTLEHAFEKMESLFSITAKKLISENLELSPEEQSYLKIFILFQRTRTPSAVQRNTRNQPRHII